MTNRKPLVFACAGCSFAGRLAYDLAQELDRRGDAEMSCLAGVGARHPTFLRKLAGRETWIVDGCPIECSRGVFEQVDRPYSRHIRLHAWGTNKHREPPGGVDVAGLADRACRREGHDSPHSDRE